MPGTREGDEAPQPPRVSPFDSGFRLHTPLVLTDRPDRLYAGWIDGGIIILDIADKAKPKEVSRISWQSLHQRASHVEAPPLKGWRCDLCGEIMTTQPPPPRCTRCSDPHLTAQQRANWNWGLAAGVDGDVIMMRTFQWQANRPQAMMPSKVVLSFH
jgi:hypothetical protein